MRFFVRSGKKLQPRDKAGIALRLFLLALLAIVMLFPLYFMVITSLGPPVESGTVNKTLLPRVITLESYRFFFESSKNSLRWILNSCIVALATMMGNVVFAGFAGYAFAKIRFRGSSLIFGVFLISMMIPYQVIQVPLYMLTVNVFHLRDTYPALILPGLCTAYNIFLMKQFMSSIPREILESAKIDGCNQFGIFVQIVAPLSKTVLSVMAITTFMDSWNNFLWPMLVTASDEMKTIQLGLTSFRFANSTYFSPMMAGACVATLPMFVLFFTLQRYFLEGVTIGAVKG